MQLLAETRQYRRSGARPNCSWITSKTEMNGCHHAIFPQGSGSLAPT